ncbi:MAG: hypothetical protein WD845_04625 [Pirellulales bacterium]
MATAEFNLLTELQRSGEAAIRHSQSRVSSSHASEIRALAGEVEDVIALLNFQLERIDRHCEAWAQAISDGEIDFTWDLSKEFAGLYSGWLENAVTLATVVNDDVFRGQLRFVKEFSDNLQRVKLMSLNSDRTQRSVESLKSGKGIPFERAMESLRDKLR